METHYLSGRSEDSMQEPARSVILRSRRRLYEGVFKLEELTVAHSSADGTVAPDRKVLVFERGDSVGALLHHRDRNEVILVEQFRAAVWVRNPNAGWLVEMVAGVIEEGETAEEAIRREVLEETGFKVGHFEPVAAYFSSPGACSERVSLFYAEVTDADKVRPGGGNPAEGEDIRIVNIGSDALFARIARREIEDPKLLIAACHCKERLVASLQTERR
jgi:nudix-type nucleoside diphosphatase (YffH/AdpP family)